MGTQELKYCIYQELTNSFGKGDVVLFYKNINSFLLDT